MSLQIPFLAHSTSLRWLLSLTYKPNHYCVIGTLARLNKIERDMQKGSVTALIAWFNTLERLRRFRQRYQDEAKQLKRLVLKRTKASVRFESLGVAPITLPVQSTLAFAFFEVLLACDQLMSWLDCAYTYGVLKKRTAQHRKQRNTVRGLIQWMNQFSRLDLQEKALADLAHEECVQAQKALQHAHLPLLNSPFFQSIKTFLKGALS